MPHSGTDSCTLLHLRICVLTFFQGKERSPITGSFVQSTKASRDWKDTEGERRRKKKRPLIQWSMRCFYLTSKTSWGVRAEFWLPYCSFSGWSEARDVPQSWLESYPCCFKQKIQTILLSPSLAQHVNGYFSPFFAFPPLFPSFAAFIFISGLVLYPVASGVYVKGTGFPLPRFPL